MDISPGHWVFAAVFFIAFIGVLVWSFRKDKRINQAQFGNTGIIALLIGGGILLIILLKIILRQINH
jgi:cbb3-type cytochrome oxidase subunit 3